MRLSNPKTLTLCLRHNHIDLVGDSGGKHTKMICTVKFV
jgi:hypothetical protein